MLKHKPKTYDSGQHVRYAHFQPSGVSEEAFGNAWVFADC